MMREKGTLIERVKTLIRKEKEHVYKKGFLSEVKIGHFLHLKKMQAQMGICRRKRGTYHILIGAFIKVKRAFIFVLKGGDKKGKKGTYHC